MLGQVPSEPCEDTDYNQCRINYFYGDLDPSLVLRRLSCQPSSTLAAKNVPRCASTSGKPLEEAPKRRGIGKGREKGRELGKTQRNKDGTEKEVRTEQAALALEAGRWLQNKTVLPMTFEVGSPSSSTLTEHRSLGYLSQLTGSWKVQYEATLAAIKPHCHRTGKKEGDEVPRSVSQTASKPAYGRILEEYQGSVIPGVSAADR